MHNNGVSHAVTATDFDGVCVLLHWLSYMPKVSVFLCDKIKTFYVYFKRDIDFGLSCPSAHVGPGAIVEYSHFVSRLDVIRDRRFGLVVMHLASINIVALRQTRLVPGCLWVGKPSQYVTSQLGRLSLLLSVVW